MQISKINNFNYNTQISNAGTTTSPSFSGIGIFGKQPDRDTVELSMSEKRKEVQIAEQNLLLANRVQKNAAKGDKTPLAQEMQTQREKAEKLSDLVKKGDNAITILTSFYPSNATLGDLDNDARNFNLFVSSNTLQGVEEDRRAADEIAKYYGSTDLTLAEVEKNLNDVLMHPKEGSIFELRDILDPNSKLIDSYRHLASSSTYTPDTQLSSIFTDTVNIEKRTFGTEQYEAIRTLKLFTNQYLNQFAKGEKEAADIPLSDAIKTVGKVEEAMLANVQSADFMENAIGKLMEKHPRRDSLKISDMVKMYENALYEAKEALNP